MTLTQTPRLSNPHAAPQLFNKIAGVYGLFGACFAGGTIGQLSFYIYSTASLAGFVWGLKAVVEVRLLSVRFPFAITDEMVWYRSTSFVVDRLSSLSSRRRTQHAFSCSRTCTSSTTSSRPSTPFFSPSSGGSTSRTTVGGCPTRPPRRLWSRLPKRGGILPSANWRWTTRIGRRSRVSCGAERERSLSVCWSFVGSSRCVSSSWTLSSDRVGGSSSCSSSVATDPTLHLSPPRSLRRSQIYFSLILYSFASHLRQNSYRALPLSTTPTSSGAAISQPVYSSVPSRTPSRAGTSSARKEEEEGEEVFDWDREAGGKEGKVEH